MNDRPRNVPLGTLLGDFIMFELKLFVDGLKDVVLAPLAVFGLVVDVILRPGGRGRLFYGIMGAGRRFDDWLGLFEHRGSATLRRPGRGLTETGPGRDPG